MVPNRPPLKLFPELELMVAVVDELDPNNPALKLLVLEFVDAGVLFDPNNPKVCGGVDVVVFLLLLLPNKPIATVCS